MKRFTRIPYILMAVSIAFLAAAIYCEAEKPGSAGELINQAKLSIEKGNKEKALLKLGEAFDSANSEGNPAALMQIGDLYISIDPSLKDKAMDAWTAAGRMKCR